MGAAFAEREWAELVRVFNPFEPLSEDLDALYVDRADAPSGRIRNELALSPETRAKFVLLGARGAGKTTELWRLARLLEGKRYVVGVDLSLSGIEDPTAFEVVLLIALRLLRDLKAVRPAEAGPLERELGEVYQAAKKEGARPDLGVDDAVKVIGGSIAGLSGVPAAGVAAIGAGVGLLSKAARHVLAQRRARTDVEDTDAGAGLLDVFHRVVERLEHAIGIPALVLVDGLDMVFDPQRIYPLFVKAPFLAAAPVAFVLVGPISILPSPPLVNALRSRMKLERVRNLPMYHLLEDGQVEATAEAQEASRRLIEARALRVGRRGEDVVPPEAVAPLTAASGGVLRGLVRLVQEALIGGDRERGLTEPDWRRAIDRERRELQSAVQREDTMRVLAATLRRRVLPSEPRGRAEELLYEGFILHHEDGESWYRPHEILVPLVERYAQDLDGR